jgi:hypothetical protein
MALAAAAFVDAATSCVTTACAAGFKFAPAIDSTTDATCTPCATNEFKAGVNADTVCVAKKITCPAGEYFTASLDSTADAACVVCGAGTFNAGDNADDECTAWRTCLAGQGKSVEGSAIADIECETCTDEDKTYSQIDDISVCQDHTQCGVGFGSTWESLTDATKAESTCAGCGDTEYSDAEDYGPCRARMTTCPAGEAFTAGSATADRTCSACTSGYVDAQGTAAAQASCTAWTATCPQGRGKLTAGTASADMVCETCTDTNKKYSQSDDSSACQDHTQCGVGFGSTWESLIDATKAESTCAACNSTIDYSDADGFGACTLVTVCTAAQYETSAPTASADRECEDLTTCGVEEHEVTSATAMTDRVCATSSPTAFPTEFPTASPTASPTVNPTSQAEAKPVTAAVASSLVNSLLSPNCRYGNLM